MSSGFQSNAFQSNAVQALSAAVTRQGDGGKGWERFKDLKPRKYIPQRVQEVIIDLLVREAKAPVTTLKQELKALEIKYDPAYGEFLKKALKIAIQEAKDEEEMLIMWMM